MEQYSFPTPPEIERAVRDVGGLNRFGKPNYRLRWGYQCLELRGGEHHDYDEHGNFLRSEIRYEWWPKYAPANERFHLEVWVPPERYGTPEQWYDTTKKWLRGESVVQLGPYPSMGDYELVATMEDPDGEFVMPERWAVELMIRTHQRLRHRTPQQIKADIEADEAARTTALQKKYRDILDSEARAFPWTNWVPVTGTSPKQLYS